MQVTFLVAAAALAAYAPCIEAFAPAQCIGSSRTRPCASRSALSLIMSTSRRTVSASGAVSTQPLTAFARRDVLAAAPLIAAGAGALLAPSAALASFSIGESLQFIPEGGFQSEGAMQWPARLSPDAVLPVGNARMPSVGFGVCVRACCCGAAHEVERPPFSRRAGEWGTFCAGRRVTAAEWACEQVCTTQSPR